MIRMRTKISPNLFFRWLWSLINFTISKRTKKFQFKYHAASLLILSIIITCSKTHLRSKIIIYFFFHMTCLAEFYKRKLNFTRLKLNFKLLLLNLDISYFSWHCTSFHHLFWPLIFPKNSWKTICKYYCEYLKKI
jgi:hypothetical protein